LRPSVTAMAFSQLTMTDVQVTRDDVELYVVWSASILASSFQVYVDRRLAWYGSQQFCTVPIPFDAVGRNVWVEVGTVAAGELTRDFSDELSGPVGTGSRASLAWYGGTYLDPTATDDIQGYRIYRSTFSGGTVDTGTSLASIPAYPGGMITDGFGMGAFGLGGFGRVASFYEWRSEPLPSGVWTFAVSPYDKEGNSQSSPTFTSVTIIGAPPPPRADERGNRLSFSYSGPSTRIATLNWLATPS
jgi:hypothetical protein